MLKNENAMGYLSKFFIFKLKDYEFWKFLDKHHWNQKSMYYFTFLKQITIETIVKKYGIFNKILSINWAETQRLLYKP